MRLDALDYDLPPELIAQEPAAARERARLMTMSSRAPILHTHVADLAEHVAPGTLVVVNDTRVMRARIVGTKEGTGGKTEIFLLRKLSEHALPSGAVQTWRALARASKGLRPGMRVRKSELVAELLGKTDDGLFEVAISTCDGSPIDDAVRAAGQIPLPPYIKRAPRPEDEERYQTVYARAEGSVAAPTAGLHLTHALLEALRSRGCEIASCTLHIGLGTFQPVAVPDLDDHPMHAEYFEVTHELATSVARARDRGAPVLAIGTTVVRTLESAKDPERPGLVRPCAEETRLLIQPGYRFEVVDRLFTNFHLPKSTLLALVSAFGGLERTLEAYRLAVREGYRFFSYGDAMLLERAAATPPDLAGTP
jgi:S-adenosylmethionine:tRNA ribosyltransferase-isomerase